MHGEWTDGQTDIVTSVVFDAPDQSKFYDLYLSKIDKHSVRSSNLELSFLRLDWPWLRGKLITSRLVEKKDKSIAWKGIWLWRINAIGYRWMETGWMEENTKTIWKKGLIKKYLTFWLSHEHESKKMVALFLWLQNYSMCDLKIYK